MAESASGLILRMTRTFDAEPARVFAAWTDPQAFGSWFGPAGMKTVLCEVDPKVGGAWRLMGEGKEIPGRHEPGVVRPTVSGKYLEIEPPNRLVFTFAWHEKDDFASPRDRMAQGQSVEEMVRAVAHLAGRRVGALIVLQNEVGLNEYIDVEALSGRCQLQGGEWRCDLP